MELRLYCTIPSIYLESHNLYSHFSNLSSGTYLNVNTNYSLSQFIISKRLPYFSTSPQCHQLWITLWWRVDGYWDRLLLCLPQTTSLICLINRMGENTSAVPAEEPGSIWMPENPWQSTFYSNLTKLTTYDDPIRGNIQMIVRVPHSYCGHQGWLFKL